MGEAAVPCSVLVKQHSAGDDLSRGRTFRTVYRTLPDIPDTDRTWFSDMIGHTIGHQSDIDRTLIGQYRTQIGQ